MPGHAANQSSATSPEVQPSRVVWVDVARALAVVFMVQGHTIDVLLAPEYRQGIVFDWWLFLRGLTAPMFLVVCGFSFALASFRRPDRLPRLAPKRIFRFVSLIAIGYAMHTPVAAWRDLYTLSAAGWESWYQVDVLQCIGVTLLALQFVAWLAQTPQRCARVAFALGSIIVLATPLAWSGRWVQQLPGVIGAYFNGAGGSLFPLFPWAGYVFFGVWLALTRREINAVPSFRLLLGAGLALIATGLYLNTLPFTLYRHVDFWTTSPNLFLLRFGFINVLLSVIALIPSRVRVLRRVPQSFARESLVVYVAHLAILYGSAWNEGLRQWVGPTLRVPTTILTVFSLLISMWMLAVVWRRVQSLLSAAAGFTYQKALAFGKKKIQSGRAAQIRRGPSPTCLLGRERWR